MGRTHQSRIAQVLSLKSDNCRKFTVCESEPSFFSLLVTEGACPQRILCNRKLQENLFSELSQ